MKRNLLTHICILWQRPVPWCISVQSGLWGDTSRPSLEITLVYGKSNPIFFLSLSLSLLPSFISVSVGSYYPSWNDFNRDTAIPRELPPLCNSIHSHGQLVSQWFIEIFSLRVSLTPTTLGILLQHFHYSGCLSQVRTRQPGPDH